MRRLMSAWCWAVRFVGAILLISSAVIHLGNPYLFLGSVLQYELIAHGASLVVAAILPPLSLVVGCLLVMSVWPRFALALAGALFVSFAGAQWFALITDKSIGCGCFGVSSGTVTVTSASLVSACAVVSWVTAFFSDVSGMNRSRAPVW